jgi:hypothetical protein
MRPSIDLAPGAPPGAAAPEAPRRPASLGAAAASQLRQVLALGWPELGAGVVLFLAACAFVATRVHGNPVHSYADRQLALHFLTLPFAASWPLVVWRDHAPRQRGDLASLPASLTQVTALRVGAGLVLFLAAWAAANFGGFLIGAAFGRGGEFAAVSGFAWLACLLGAAIVYLLGSAIAVASDAPGRWVLVLLALVYAPPLMLTLPETLRFAVRPGPRWIYDNALGLERAIRFAVNEAQLDTRLLEFTPRRWLPAALFWLGLAASLVGLASRRRPDL